MRRSTAALGIALGFAVVGCGHADDTTLGATPEVALVEATGCDRPQPRYGVGTFVADGIVLTAAHVVDGDLRELRVAGAPATVVGMDVRADLALVAILDGSEHTLNWTVARHDDVRPGPVRIVSPDGSVDAGLVRTLTLRVDDITDDTTTERRALELDVVVDEGDSGSPVIDSTGGLVGVVVLRRPSTGVSYTSAVPVFTELLDQALYQEVRRSPLARPQACT